MDAYIPKPIQAKELLNLIERLTGNPAASETEASAARPPGNGPDMDAALELLDGDTDLFQEVLSRFLEEAPEQIATLRQAVSGGRAEEVERAAHRLKGSIGNFAFPAAFHTAQKLEKAGKAGELASAQETLAALEKLVGQLQATLADFQAKMAT
jgi:HPt (histidine-containing phosphotransfer) domain-containing protein